MYPLLHESEMLRLQAVQSGAHFVHFTLGREDFPIELLRRDLVGQQAVSVTSLYVVTETICLLHSRFGTQTVQALLTDIMLIVEVVWADVPMHAEAVTAMLAHPGKSGPSLVDCMSIEVIRRRGIEDVFAYDRHFADRASTCWGSHR
jgi:predicted nucleic acid-binding protein